VGGTSGQYVFEPVAQAVIDLHKAGSVAYGASIVILQELINALR